MTELTGIDTVLALADTDDAGARVLLVTLGTAQAARLDAQLRQYTIAARQHRNDRPAASALVASVRANVGVSPYARVGAVLVDQVARSHVRPPLALAALAPELRANGAALLGAITVVTANSGAQSDPTRLEAIEFVEHVVHGVAHGVPPSAAHTATVTRMLSALDRYCHRARRRTVAVHPQLTTWRIDTARTRIAEYLAAQPAPQLVH